MAYYKFPDGTTSLSKNIKEHFESLSNPKVWIVFSIFLFLAFVVFLIIYFRNRNAKKQNFGFRFY